jgi:hypothetical protein
MKIGRNQPCWCGSGKKYKKCHLHRENQKKVQPWEAIAGMKKAFGAKYCSVPEILKTECSGNIIRAHTVSKSSNLKKISLDGHVYAFVPSFDNLTKNNGVLHPELIGINKASTFTGFCKHHDKQIFSPLEDQPFEASKEQCFLLAYRAQAREFFTKTSSTNILDMLKSSDKGKNIAEQLNIQSMVHHHSEGIDAGVKDATYHKDKLDTILCSQDFNNVNAYVINFRKTPTVMCSAGIFPEYDFLGNKLHDLLDLKTIPDLMTFSVIATDTGGAVVFCWISDENSHEKNELFIESLKNISHEKLTSSLIRFFFEFCENIFMEPTWWEDLPEPQRRYLINRLATSAMITETRKKTCLCDDGTWFDDWGLISTEEI